MGNMEWLQRRVDFVNEVWKYVTEWVLTLGGILQNLTNFKIGAELSSSRIPPPILVLWSRAEAGGNREVSEVAYTQNISRYKWKASLKEELLDSVIVVMELLRKL
jgi:hypothetical protein